LAYSEAIWILPSMAALGAVSTLGFGIQSIKLIAFNMDDVSRLALSSGSLTLGFGLIAHVLNMPSILPKALFFGVTYFSSSVGVRALVILAIRCIRNRFSSREPVAIFGAGDAGIQLASALRRSKYVRPALFLDDSPYLQGMAVGGVPVKNGTDIVRNLEKSGVKTVLLALPESARSRRAALVEQLEAAQYAVRSLPPLAGLFVGDSGDVSSRPIGPAELLGRDVVDLDAPEIAKTYAGRTVMVTGAGGSIGSELCRQLLHCRPERLILFEHSEFNLYEIDKSLKSEAELRGVAYVACLGSITDSVRVRQVIAEQKVDIILHAAAYKHVPMVEQNEIEGARNNVMGTKVLAEAAAEARVERFILVSTDKAVRPTNIMGATKRMAELVIQDIQTRMPHTKFSMVRFGNVLGSSGSVLPLFQSQIDVGGPVTVTHPDVSRFFMTVVEAARLVLLAGAYAEGGDVFVLDMGKPQKIMDLAKRMIELSGRALKTPFNDSGNIEIRITGLRPGEKLYEELLIDCANLRQTPHIKILRAEEDILAPDQVQAMLKELNVAIKMANSDHVRKVVRERVEGYHQVAAESGCSVTAPSI
jgi:FlaA1/EpsC-like NDP-sugar epimerase